jgi:arginine/lysine/histidine transporter system substrate-binding protein
MPFTTLIPQIQSGNLHVIAAGLTPTPERERVMFFTKPYLESDPLVVVSLAKNPKINSLDDLKGKTVIVNEGFSAERYMSALEGIDLKRLPTVADAFLSLQSGRADAFVVAANSIKPFFKQYSAAVPTTNR